MKRKLNEKDVPEAVPDTEEKPKSSQGAPSDSKPTSSVSFADFELDARLLRGVRDQGWSTPTLVQQKCINLALAGKDVLARSGTGTGKTAAYLLPVLHKTLQRREKGGLTTLILVPTKELALQVTRVAKSLSAHCGQELRVQNIAGKESSDAVVKAKLASATVCVTTPARASAHIGAEVLKNIAHVVVDEGDLIMGYGFEEDMKVISHGLPEGVQVFMMSATLNTAVESLQGLLCNDPVVLKLDDLEKDSQHITQYRIVCSEDEKFLLVYAMFKLELIKGKSIVFVGDVDRSYRLKLFLEQFGIKACVLNSELPVASRLNIVDQFNRNVYNILVASDETDVIGSRKAEKNNTRPKKKAKIDASNSDSKTDSGVSRGVDFLNVACVLNFDLPTNYKSYFHRIGRTARAGRSGTAISFVIPKDKYRKHKSTTFEGCENDEEVWRKIVKHQKEGQKVEDFAFDMKRLEPFRYRFADALRAVTRIAIREARVKELRNELLNSQKLSRYFEENPDALSALKHDTAISHPARIQQHLKHVPDYLLPAGSKRPQDIGFVGLEKDGGGGKRTFVKRGGRGGKHVVGGGRGRGRGGKVDPLKTFSARGRGRGRK